MQDLDRYTKVTCSERKAKWQRILNLLSLSPEQQAHLLQLRRDFLAKVKDILIQRQGLNMQVCAAAAPAPSRDPLRGSGKVFEGRRHQRPRGHLEQATASGTQKHFRKSSRAW